MQCADRFSIGGHVLVTAPLSLFVRKLKRNELRLLRPRKGGPWRNNLTHPAPRFQIPLVPKMPAKVIECLPEIARDNTRFQIKQRMQDDHGHISN